MVSSIQELCHVSKPELLNLGAYQSLDDNKRKGAQKALLPTHHLVTHACVLGMTMIATLCGTFLTLRNCSHTVLVRRAHGLKASTQIAAAGGSYGLARENAFFGSA
jgi:hypothetical protein